MKRFFDIIISLSGLIFLMPLIVIIAIIIVIKMRLPVFFIQTRPGKNGKPFRMLKFRTMTNEMDLNDCLLPNHKRLTTLGKTLRSLSLDEIPELVNVLKGDMSIVGPRPLLMDYLPLFNEFQMKRLNVKPGITGWAQINGRNAINWDEKFKLDVWYVENQSFWLDMAIIWKTAGKVIKREGISYNGDVAMPRFTGNNI